jgi:ubiquinone biosynthesis protein COQ9
VTACFEKGYLTVEDVLTQVGYFADHGKYVQYGAVLINKLLKHSNIEWVNKLIARAIKNGNYSKKIIKLFAQIVGYIAHPNK